MIHDLGFQVLSTRDGGEREFVRGLDSWLSSTHGRSCLGHNM